MSNTTYISSECKFRTEDPAALAELQKIDNCCAECLYEAGKLASNEVLAAVISNELTDSEKTIIYKHWFCGQSLNRIAQLYGISKESVRRAEQRAKNKIYSSMKYIILYNEILDGKKSIPQNFGFKIVRCIDGKELIS